MFWPGRTGGGVKPHFLMFFGWGGGKNPFSCVFQGERIWRFAPGGGKKNTVHHFMISVKIESRSMHNE